MQQGIGGGISSSGVVQPTAQNYFTAFLQGLHLPVTQTNLLALYGVAEKEGWNNRYNPLNVIQQEPGSTSFNSVGVQAYPNLQEGVQGGVTLYSNPHWDGVRAALARGNDMQGVLQAFHEAYTWADITFEPGNPSDANIKVGGNAGGISGIVAPNPTSDTGVSGGNVGGALGSLFPVQTSTSIFQGIMAKAQAGQLTYPEFLSWWNNKGAFEPATTTAPQVSQLLSVVQKTEPNQSWVKSGLVSVHGNQVQVMLQTTPAYPGQSVIDKASQTASNTGNDLFALVNVLNDFFNYLRGIIGLIVNPAFWLRVLSGFGGLIALGIGGYMIATAS